MMLVLEARDPQGEGHPCIVDAMVCLCTTLRGLRGASASETPMRDAGKSREPTGVRDGHATCTPIGAEVGSGLDLGRGAAVRLVQVPVRLWRWVPCSMLLHPDVAAAWARRW